jgi:hypothetical protein
MQLVSCVTKVSVPINIIIISNRQGMQLASCQQSSFIMLRLTGRISQGLLRDLGLDESVLEVGKVVCLKPDPNLPYHDACMSHTPSPKIRSHVIPGR